MSTFILKLIAILSMAVDHVGAVLYPDLDILRIIGRLAFPIFAFLLVEGFFHTKNFTKYAIRLLVFAFISEVPFDLALTGKILEFSHQNIMFTLLIGLFVLYMLKKSRNWFHRISVGIIGMGIAYFLNVDYTFVGIMVIIVFYLFRKQILQNTIAQILIHVFIVGDKQAYASLAMIPIALYNGKIGKYKMKYFFYIFYPAHLLLLFFIKNLIQRGTLI